MGAAIRVVERREPCPLASLQAGGTNGPAPPGLAGGAGRCHDHGARLVLGLRRRRLRRPRRWRLLRRWRLPRHNREQAHKLSRRSRIQAVPSRGSQAVAQAIADLDKASYPMVAGRQRRELCEEEDDGEVGSPDLGRGRERCARPGRPGPRSGTSARLLCRDRRCTSPSAPSTGSPRAAWAPRGCSPRGPAPRRGSSRRSWGGSQSRIHP